MNELARKKCKPCEGGIAPLTAEQIKPMLKGLEGWSVEGGMIAKSYSFKNYYETMAFVNALAWISHREDHHPDIVVRLQRMPGDLLHPRDRRPVGERLHLRRQVRRPVRALKRIYSSFNLAAVHHAKNVLEVEGIRDAGEERDAVLGDGRAAAGGMPGRAVGAARKRSRARRPPAQIRTLDRRRTMAVRRVRRVFGAAVHAVLALQRLQNLREQS